MGTFGQTLTTVRRVLLGRGVSGQDDCLPCGSEKKRGRETPPDCEQGERWEGEEEGGGGLVERADADVGRPGLVLHCWTLEEAVKSGCTQDQSQGDTGCSDLWDEWQS